MKSENRRHLSDLEPRRSADAVRGGRLALATSSVRVASNVDMLGKKDLSAVKVELVGAAVKWIPITS